eukprot:TRINITY_DN27363_c0_g1_i1.p1 TRINITY_DN27363_c0_g1~~TRINITY_DN27363_c0_g1_i1.p1  ORF type:complete len:304 (-),score=56.50 TRINITY_DN27363_c0_g1_i1:27-902(-)
MGRWSLHSSLVDVASLSSPKEEHKSQSEDDFIRWYSQNTPKEEPIVGEALPPGVSTMASRYGIFGAKAVIPGVPGDENKAPLACTEGESMPPPPCAATGECPELLELTRKFAAGSQKAKRLAINAIEALEGAQVLLRRVEKAAANLVRMPEVSPFSLGAPNGPGGMPWTLNDMIVRSVRGPLRSGGIPWRDYEIDSSILPRMMEKWDFEHRMVDYLQLAEDNRPLQLIPLQRLMPKFEPLPSPTPIVPSVEVTGAVASASVSPVLLHLQMTLRPCSAPMQRAQQSRLEAFL